MLHCWQCRIIVSYLVKRKCEPLTLKISQAEEGRGQKEEFQSGVCSDNVTLSKQVVDWTIYTSGIFLPLVLTGSAGRRDLWLVSATFESTGRYATRFIILFNQISHFFKQIMDPCLHIIFKTATKHFSTLRAICIFATPIDQNGLASTGRVVHIMPA